MDQEEQRAPRKWRTGAALAAAGLFAGGLLGGGMLAGTLSALADTDSNSVPTAPDTSSTARDNRDQSKSQRRDEELLTGANATKAREAALAKYPGATIERVETDSDGVYEAHLVTAQGERVTVEFDKNFEVTGEEAGRPGHGGRGGPGPEDEDSTT